MDSDRGNRAPLRGRLQVRITDANLQTITASNSVTQHSSDYYLGLGKLPRVHWTGRPLDLKVVAVKPSGQVAGAGMAFSATLNKIEWHSVKIKGAGGAVRFQNRRKVIRIDEAILQTLEIGRAHV